MGFAPGLAHREGIIADIIGKYNVAPIELSEFGCDYGRHTRVFAT